MDYDNYIPAPILSYTLSELHMLYQDKTGYPSYSTFRGWLHGVKGLQLIEKEGDYVKAFTKVLSPGQVKMIFESTHPGRPDINTQHPPQINCLIEWIKNYGDVKH